jgi:DNA-binding HxlR family transcriptional regulator
VGISSNVLTGRLEQLVREVLITIKIYGGSTSLKVEYRLNPLALELDDILNNLDRWIDKWISYKNKNVSLT